MRCNPPRSTATLCLLAITAGLTSQPHGEQPIDLAERLGRLVTGAVDQRLAELRRLALHRHLFAPPNRDRTIETLRRLMGGADAQLGQAAAVVFYLERESKTPNAGPVDAPSDAAWLTTWALGLRRTLDQATTARLRANLTAGDAKVRAWSTFALSRHRPADATLHPHLLDLMRRGTPDQRALAARRLAAGHVHLQETLIALESSPRDLRPYYARAVVAFAAVDPRGFDTAIPRLSGCLTRTGLDTRGTLAAALRSRATLDLPRIRVLLELLAEVDDTQEGSFRGYHARRLRTLVAERLATVEARFDGRVLASVEAMLREPEPNPALFVFIGRMGPRAHRLKPALFARLDHAHWRERVQAAEALGRIGHLTGEELRRLAARLKDDGESFRQAVANTLATAGERAGFAGDLMFERLEAGDRHVAEGLGRLAAVSDKILDLLVSTPPPAEPKARIGRAAALGRSNRRRDPRVIRWLADALNHPESRLGVIFAVQQLGSTDARLIARLVGLLNESRDDTDLYAARCLAALHCAKAEVHSTLLRYLRAESGFDAKRHLAARGLVRYPDLDPAIIREIATHLRTSRRVLNGAPRWYFNEQIALALGELGSAGRPAIPAMLAALTAEQPLHASHVQTLLESLGKISAEPAKVIPAILDHVGHRSSHIASAARAAILGYSGDAIPVLEAIVKRGVDPQATRARELIAALRPK